MKQGISSAKLDIGLSLMSPFVFGLLALTQKQDVNSDLLGYHYYVGYSFFSGSWLHDSMPAGDQSYLEPLLNIFYYLLIRTAPPMAVGFIIGCLQGLVFVSLYWISGYFTEEIKSRPIRFLIRLLGALSGVYATDFLSELGNTMGDTLTGVFSVVGFGSLLKARQEGRRIFESLSGVSFGIAAGLKLTNGIYLLGILVTLGIVALFFREQIFPLIRVAISGVAGFLLVGGYWIWALWKRFENPIFPFYNRFFHSSYAIFSNFSDTRWFPHSLTEWMFFPFFFTPSHQIMELSVENFAFMFIYTLIITYLIVKMVSIVRRSKESLRLSENERLLLIFFGVSFVIWELVFSYYRYLSPLESLAPMAILVLLRQLLEKIYTVVYVGILVFMAFHIEYPDWGRIPWGKSYFGVETSGLHLPQSAMVLVGSHLPVFLIPDLPRGFVYVRIARSDFRSDFWRLRDRVRISRYDGPVFLLTDKATLHGNKTDLEWFGMTMPVNPDCRTIPNRVDPSLILCQIPKGPPKLNP